jgi:two-component system, OmpR family, phosphate regulon sensor histidine kinase PhoR
VNTSLSHHTTSLVEAAELVQEIAHLRELNHMLVMLLSHELGTPTTHILAYLRLLQERAPIAEQIELNLVVEQALTLKSRLEDLVLLNQLEAGSWELDVTPVSIQEIVVRVVQAQRERLAEKSLTLNTHIECNKRVNADREMLYRALEHIVANACKFSRPYGSIQVRIECIGSDCCVTVTDEGIGIPAEKQTQIFEPFYQVDLTRTRRYNGLGIGLRLVHAIIERHHGEIHVSSQMGRGSTFALTIPLV